MLIELLGEGIGRWVLVAIYIYSMWIVFSFFNKNTKFTETIKKSTFKEFINELKDLTIMDFFQFIMAIGALLGFAAIIFALMLTALNILSWIIDLLII